MFEQRRIADQVARSQLADRGGLHPLEASISALLSTGIGTLTAWVQEGTTEEQLHNLRESPCLGLEGDDPLVDAIRSCLESDQGSVIITEDQLASATDGFLKGLKWEFHNVGDTVYHVVRSDALGLAEEDFDWATRMGRAHWHSAILPCRSEALLDALKSGMTGDTLWPSLRSECKEIWFQAYDGDGYICWSLSPTP